MNSFHFLALVTRQSAVLSPDNQRLKNCAESGERNVLRKAPPIYPAICGVKNIYLTLFSFALYPALSRRREPSVKTLRFSISTEF